MSTDIRGHETLHHHRVAVSCIFMYVLCVILCVVQRQFSVLFIDNKHSVVYLYSRQRRNEQTENRVT